MTVTVILAVGADSLLLENQTSFWQSAGYFMTPVHSIREAIERFKGGDFDLVLLGHSIPAESSERLTFLIRAFGSRIPVVCITESSGDCSAFAGATIRNEPQELLVGIGELVQERAGVMPGEGPHKAKGGKRLSRNID